MIPKLHYISQGSTPKEHLENIQKACNSGIELVQLHLDKISDKKHLIIAQEARDITSNFQTRLIIKDDYKVARAVKADGVYFENTNFSDIKVRIHLYTWQIIGAAANTLEDCNTLLEKQVDYICLGPFKGKETKNNVPPTLGIQGYAGIIDVLKTETPILGVGGIIEEDVTDILNTGISGIAVSEAITRDFNSIKKFNQLLGASAIEEKRHTFK